MRCHTLGNSDACRRRVQQYKKYDDARQKYRREGVGMITLRVPPKRGEECSVRVIRIPLTDL